MNTIISAALTVLIPVLVAVILMCLPRRLMEKNESATVSPRLPRSGVKFVEIPEMLAESNREDGPRKAA